MFGIQRIISCLVLVLSCTSLSWGQFPFPQRGAASEDVFLLAPRAVLRVFREGELAIQEQRYADGIAALSSLLQSTSPDLPPDLQGQDYFIDQGTRGLFSTSVKGEVIRILGELPAEGRRTLEVQIGVTARQELDQALSSRDISGIADIARKYVHTNAAYDAQVILAQYRLTTGYPLAAAAMLQDLLGYPAARSRYGVGLAKSASEAWIAAGQHEKAVATLRMASQDFAGQSIQWNGRQIALDEAADWEGIVQGASEELSPHSDPSRRDAWLVTGGGPERNAIADGGMPLSNARWVLPHSSLPEQEALHQMAATEQQQGKVLLPKFELRMTDDLVLTRTTDASVLAIDFETGNIAWPFYFHAAPVSLTNVTFTSGGADHPAISAELQNRIWGSSAFGRFSLDEEQFYLVSTASDKPLTTDGLFGASNDGSTTNFLEGVSIAAQGAIVWRIGGASGDDEPALSGAYFLGPPLPYRGELYALAEIRGETKLVVLDAATGRLRWSQQLAQSMVPPLQHDRERQSQALSPTIADGVVLCPTGVGAVVAVDLVSRRLRWGVTYTTNRSNDVNSFRRGAFGYGTEYAPLDRRWHDPAMIAQDGVVLVSPPESDDMFCRDILTGSPRLAPQRRNAWRYVAGLRDGNIITVGERHVSAVRMGTGSLAWEYEYPPGLALVGKGLWQSDSLLLPLSDRRVIRVDTRDGRLLEQTQVDQPLGNLFAYKDQLLSVSSTAVAAYYTRDALAEEVEQRLVDDDQDTWALNQKSQLALMQDDVNGALELLIDSFELNEQDADTRYLLVETLLAGLAEDFDRFEPVAQKYDRVVEYGPQRFRFLQRMAVGSLKSGQHVQAARRLLELIPKLGSTFSAAQQREPHLSLEENYIVDSDAWLAAALARSFAAADAQGRREIEKLVQKDLDEIRGTMVPLRRERLRYLGWLPNAAEVMYELSQELQGGEEQTLAEQMAQPLLFHSDPKWPGRARQLLTKPAIADMRLLGPQGNLGLPFAAGNDVIEGLPLLRADAESEAATPVSEWNSGLVEISASRDGSYQFGSKIDLKSERFGRPSISVALSGSLVVISNANGDDVGHFDYPRASADTSEVFTQAVLRGGLLLIETGSEIAAFDVYRGLISGADALLWRHSLMTPGAGPTREFEMPGVSSVNTPLGFLLSKRQMPGGQQAIVGPLTPVGVAIQTGTKVSMLDAMTGKVLWARDGFDDKVRLAASGLEVAVVNPSLGVTQIFDCRDGAAIRETEYRGDWAHWFSHQGWMVDFSLSQTVPPTPNKLRVWNALTGETLRELNLAVGARADVCEGRYLVIIEPTSKLHYFDLEDSHAPLYKQHEVAVERQLESIAVERFQDRLVVLTSNSKLGRRFPNLESADGYVYGLQHETGELSWSQAGRLSQMHFPRSQPRQSPFMVAFRIDSSSNERHRAALVLVDLRTGRIAFSNNSLPLNSNEGFAMTLRPITQTIEMGLGTRSLRFTVTDRHYPPQPVFRFGPTRANSRGGSQRELNIFP